jgi:hypothetical protein
MRTAGLPLAPTFIPFTPWTTMAAYRDFLRAVAALDMVEQVAPVQLAIRLLLPEGSLLLELPEVRAMIEPFNPRSLCYRWRNADSQLDALCLAIQETVKRTERRGQSRREIFRKVWDLANAGEFPVDAPMVSRAAIPYLTEPWYC